MTKARNLLVTNRGDGQQRAPHTFSCIFCGNTAQSELVAMVHFEAHGPDLPFGNDQWADWAEKLPEHVFGPQPLEQPRFALSVSLPDVMRRVRRSV